MSLKAERKRLFKTYGQLYRWHSADGVNRHECFYCGDSAETLDHAPPLSWVETQDKKAWAKHGVRFVLLPACRHCNSLLGNRPLFRALERAQFIEQALLKRYDKEASLWAPDEIAEMSPEFQRVIAARRKKTNYLLVRVRHAQWRLLQYESFPDDNPDDDLEGQE
jgi:hypothetical protein